MQATLVVSSVSHLCRYKSHKTAVQSAHQSFLIHTGASASCRQLQLHCLSWMNPFIPCVCAFTYLSLSIIFTADTSSSNRLQLSLLFSRVQLLNHIREHVNIILEYTEHFRAYRDLGIQGVTNTG